jgi:hypothetical protein
VLSCSTANGLGAIASAGSWLLESLASFWNLPLLMKENIKIVHGNENEKDKQELDGKDSGAKRRAAKSRVYKTRENMKRQKKDMWCVHTPFDIWCNYFLNV